ncbi:bacteriohemerythrin [Magnetofaba australis]|uniref:Putative hemerythrin-like metal-binding protein n=1 Tax=Magnetofaba australis IT-1 TaxID=1434232 RepID=A0A1Y2K2Y2_9PROT|nr:hemerythrin family protein [Magnetofaba australis]OSM01395.1 putative hemerythrin-like metal-binding protein [Magnetofaba australis IT-1]
MEDRRSELYPQLRLTGVQAVDLQHEVLFSLLDSLRMETQRESSAFSVDSAIKALKLYVQTHFTYEESLMLAQSYEHYGDHLTEHRAFEKELPDLERELDDLEDKSAREEALTRIMRFLESWLTHHINEIDTELFGDPKNFRPAA